MVGYTGSAASTRALSVAATAFQRARLIVAFIDQDVLASVAPYLLPSDMPHRWGIRRNSREDAERILDRGVAMASRLGAQAESLCHDTTANPAIALAVLAEEHDADVVVVGRRGAKPFYERFRLDAASLLQQNSRRPVLIVVDDANATSAHVEGTLSQPDIH